VADVFGQRVPPGLEGEATCCWRLEMSAVLVPLPVPEFKRTAEGQGERTESGLLIEWLRRGEGPTLRRDQRAIVHYAGWLEDGTLFDSSFQRGDVSNFRLDQVVPGWTEGLQRMNVGSIARLTLPWQLAYGEAGKGEIPPRANLIFYVEVLGIEE
jgi:FKBP-type peptidyl-prolyl cis-trans isomerase